MKITPVNALLLAATMFVGYQLVASPAPASSSLPSVPPDLTDQPAKTTTLPTTGGGSAYPLKKGSRGTEVRKLQTHLGVSVDGIFGVQTENALYQRHGVKSVVSAAKLAEWLAASKDVAVTPVPAPKPVASTSYSNADAEYLFNLLVMPPPRNGSGMSYYPRSTAPEATMVAIPARLAHYTSAQLLALKAGYAKQHAAKKRATNGSLYADIVAAVPTAKWTSLFKAFMSKVSASV